MTTYIYMHYKHLIQYLTFHKEKHYEVHKYTEMICIVLKLQ